MVKGYEVSSFYHVFPDAGIYVFRDAGDIAKETVIPQPEPLNPQPSTLNPQPSSRAEFPGFRQPPNPTPDAQVVGVVSPVVDCPRAFLTNPIQPLSAALLRSFPDSEDGGQSILSPDYNMIFGVSGGLAGALLLTLTLLYVRKNTGWRP